jgi:hypothetical protein
MPFSGSHLNPALAQLRGEAQMVARKEIGLQQPEVWLQAKVENGLATFFYSLDGEAFMPLGDEVLLVMGGVTPNTVGFYTMNAEEKGYMDVDWFKYDYDGPKGKK